MGSDESHFNVSLIVRDKVTETVSKNHNPFEEKGEPERNRVEALLLTSLTPYRWAKPAHPSVCVCVCVSTAVRNKVTKRVSEKQRRVTQQQDNPSCYGSPAPPPFS